jgi:hypothetical protein
MNSAAITLPNGMTLTLSPKADSRIASVLTDMTMGTVVYAKSARMADELRCEYRAWGAAVTVAVG